ncbi:OsmC family protein [Streptomyces reniochalinae]|uniref:OsmC family peroxiredoxin n=1 Tax=Streptomyces reniochalinae TaxID=2250578 RepID=A0A367E8H4_9ACTN|nr:OsmC family protein [Streptomyces reniochalinae]RCG13677.1 OsmC family peroxiredoxin [Streptomyces reniochalinae]
MTQIANSLNGVDRDALKGTLEAVQHDPHLAKVSFTLGADWQGGCRQRAVTGATRQAGTTIDSRTARYTLESDEPAALLGSDTAASPAEYVLQALAGCYAVTFATHAANRGIELSSLRLDMEADFDLQGFLGLDEKTRPGAQEIRVTVHAESPNTSRGGLLELTAFVQEHSPIRDILAHEVRVSTDLA